MQDFDLRRKITAPPLPAALLHRKALLERLREAVLPAQSDAPHRQLILCCAPAGYGKTTLLADFARSTQLPCCWYFLERSDRDPVVFLRTLLASLRQTFPPFGASLDTLFRSILSAESASAPTLYTSALTMLCTALATEIREPFLLLLCNYEEVNESETVNALVNELLRRFPPQATLIIESRSIPDLSFPALITREAIYGLDHEALRFSAEEIAELAALQGLPPLSEEEAASLVTSFDGWIAGILLGTRIGDARVRLLLHQASAADEKRGSFTTPMVQKRATLLTYLTDEVLKHDAQTQSFLQSISLLHHVDPLFCNELLDITDAQERLAHLERQGLFVFSHASSTGLFYTIHPVVRELLSEQLRQRKAERFRQLHRRAAELWHARHEDEEAMYHALESESYDLAVSFILATAENLLSLGQRETLMRWINMLPEALREHHPRLLLLQATIALDYGQRTTALPLLDCAEALLTTSQEPDTALLEATCAILRSKALFQAGDYQQAQLLCQKAVLYLPEQERHLRASAQMRLGICHTLQGDLMGGVMHLQQALQLWSQQPPPAQSIEIHNALANTYYLLGNLVLAQHHLTAMQEACEQLRDTLGQVSARILQGLIAQDEGRIAEAEAILLEVLSLARSSPYSRRGEAYALVNLAGIALEQGDYARALACAQEGLSLARTFGTRSLVNAALSNLALSYLCLRDPTSALLMAEQMEAETTDEKAAGYERAWRDLTIGLIFLAQGRYAEAATCLRGIAVALHRTHLQRARLQAELRLAVCYYLQHQPERAEHALGEVVSILRDQPTFAHLAQQEWRLLRTFLPELGKHPCLAALEALLASTPQTQVALPTTLQPPVPSPSTTVVISQERVAASLTIYAFGEPMVLLNGQPIKHWRMARAMELFFFLLDARYPVSKEMILTALWPEYDEGTTRTFHNTLYYLRKILGEACILFTPAGYTLNLTAGYGDQVWYDVQLFEDQRLVAEAALAEGQLARAKTAFREMVQLYRGDYGRPFYREWCTRRRDELRTIYLEACRQLAQIAWREEAWSESAEYWRRMLLLDSCLEEAHYGLIRCYLRQGKRGAALRQYQTCQRILQEELGVQPGHALQLLYQRLTNT